MAAELKKHGCKEIFSNVWQVPDGRYYRGPALAYHMFMGFEWPCKECSGSCSLRQNMSATPVAAPSEQINFHPELGFY